MQNGEFQIDGDTKESVRLSSQIDSICFNPLKEQIDEWALWFPKVI